jgi:RNA polymerase primary sigma factor
LTWYFGVLHKEAFVYQHKIIELPLSNLQYKNLPINHQRRLSVEFPKKHEDLRHFALLSNSDKDFFSYSDLYIEQILRIPYLTKTDENKYFEQYLKGDENAKDAIVESYLPTIYNIAQKYVAQSPDIDIQDLIGEGVYALCKAIPYYEPSSPARLITFAMHGIRAAMYEYVLHNRIVHLPTNQIVSLRKIETAYDRFEQENERRPSAEELASVLNEPVDRVADALKMSGESVSLEGYEDLICTENEDSPFYKLYQESLAKEIDRALEQLTPREADILRKFGGIGVPEKTLEEIGIEFNLTRERVRQIKEKAVRKLKVSSRARILRLFLGEENFYELSPGSRLCADSPIAQRQQITKTVQNCEPEQAIQVKKSVEEIRKQRKQEKIELEVKVIEERIAQIIKYNLNELVIPEDQHKKINHLRRLISESRKVLQQLDEWIVLKRKFPALKMISIEDRGNILTHLDKNFAILKESSLVSSRTLEELHGKINIFHRICELEDEQEVEINTLNDPSANFKKYPLKSENNPVEEETADIVLTHEIIESARTPNGGFTKSQLAALGLGWPPKPFNWEIEKVGMLITKSQLEQFKSIKYAVVEESIDDINIGQSELLQYQILFLNMNRNKTRGEFAPHKPILLLAIIDVIEENLKYYQHSVLLRKPIPFRSLLEEKFNCEWNKHVRSKIFEPTFFTPLIHMQNEPFYRLAKRRGIYNKCISSMKQLEQSFNGIKLDYELLSLMIHPNFREELRKILIDMI